MLGKKDDVMLLWLMRSTILVQERVYDCGTHPMWAVGAVFVIVSLFWGLVIVAVVFGIRWLISQGKESRSDSALEILRQRYARGEINKEEFEARKQDLL